MASMDSSDDWELPTSLLPSEPKAKAKAKPKASPKPKPKAAIKAGAKQATKPKKKPAATAAAAKAAAKAAAAAPKAKGAAKRKLPVLPPKTLASYGCSASESLAGPPKRLRVGSDCSGWCTDVMASHKALSNTTVQIDHVFACDSEKSVRTDIVSNEGRVGCHWGWEGVRVGSG